MENDKLYEIKIELPECPISQCIRQTVRFLNDQLKILNTNMKILENPDFYCLYMAKKSGKPKFDYPPFDNE